jgi:thiol-disulfide isomerase/thioredoxin
MRQLVFSSLLLLMFVSNLFAQAYEPKVEVVKFDWYENLMRTNTDTTFIVNFWATWCMPCVAELPYFEQLQQRYKSQKVKVYLVSLDFVKQKEQKLIPFLTKQKIKSEVVLLNEPDYNAWIDKVNPAWSGALPATVIFNKKRKQQTFFENETTFNTLDSITSKFISP